MTPSAVPGWTTGRIGAAGLGVAVFVVVSLVTRTPFVGVVPAVLAAAVPVAVEARARARERAAVTEAWPDALREVAVHLSAGRSLVQALIALGEVGPEPLRPVFVDFAALVRDDGTAGALAVVGSRLADPVSDRVVEVLTVAAERGGPAVRPVIADLVVAATEDRKVAEEIETAALELRINGRAVLVLPWLVLVALTARPGPFRAFYGSTGGAVVLLIAVGMGSLGAWWLARLGRPTPEPRVFAGVGERR